MHKWLSPARPPPWPAVARLISRTGAPAGVIVGVAGLQNSGKTTLIEMLVPKVVAAGFTVAAVKHIGHDDLRVDPAGTDTRRHRAAGARLSVAASPSETVFFHEGGLDLDEVLRRIEGMGTFDLVLVEGFKKSALPKIVVGKVEHGGKARWTWDGTPAGAAEIAESLMEAVRAERASARRGRPRAAPTKRARAPTRRPAR
jgi:molybdopterin-guanine dinucleotide biosynthesis protein MobB